MECAVYKSRLRDGYYLFVAADSDFSEVPAALLTLLGAREWVMNVDLAARQTLAQAEPGEVMRLIRQQGYYLQVPPQETPPAGPQH